MTQSLREQILAAPDEQIIEALLQTGAEYKEATPRTRGRWRSAARKRRAELKAVGK